MAVPGGSRCLEHHREFERAHVTPSQKVTQTSRWRRLRAKVIAERRLRDGTWECEICHAPIEDTASVTPAGGPAVSEFAAVAAPPPMMVPAVALVAGEKGSLGASMAWIRTPCAGSSPATSRRTSR